MGIKPLSISAGMQISQMLKSLNAKSAVVALLMASLAGAGFLAVSSCVQS